MNVFMHGGNGLYYCRLQKKLEQVRSNPLIRLCQKIHELKLGGYERGKKTGSFGGGSGL